MGDWKDRVAWLRRVAGVHAHTGKAWVFGEMRMTSRAFANPGTIWRRMGELNEKLTGDHQ